MHSPSQTCLAELHGRLAGTHQGKLASDMANRLRGADQWIAAPASATFHTAFDGPPALCDDRART